MAQYRTKTGDMIDAICQKYYGRQSGVVERVYKSNRGLADYGTLLPSGLVIELPDIPVAVSATSVKLWD